MELFYDLVYVAAVSILAGELAGNITFGSALSYVVVDA